MRTNDRNTRGVDGAVGDEGKGKWKNWVILGP